MKPSTNDEPGPGGRPRHGHRILRALRWILPTALVAALAFLAFGPKPLEADLGTVILGPMEITVDNEGETRVRERYLISSPLPGRVLRINLEPGDDIRKGDPLAIIIPEATRLLDPRARAQARALVSAAEAALTQAEEQVELAIVAVETTEKAHRRNRELHAAESLPDAALESSEQAFLTARHTLHAAESGVELAWFELEQAKAALLHAELDTPTPDAIPRLSDPEFIDEPPGSSDSASASDSAAPSALPGDPDGEWSFVIKAPIDGKVLRVPEKSGRPLQAGTPLLEIGDPRDLEISIEVLSQDAVMIRPGQPVLIEHWGGKAPITGHVRHVEPSAFTKVSALGVDEQRVKVIADFHPPDNIEEPGELGDGFRVEARIVVWETSEALQVPASALFRRNGSWAVFRIDGKDGRARLTAIEIDHRNGDAGEVVSGLAEGDRVVLHPGGSISDGTRIKERE